MLLSSRHKELKTMWRSHFAAELGNVAREARELKTCC